MMKEGQGKFNLERDIRIKSAVEMIRDRQIPEEIDGEKVLIYEQAAYDASNLARSTWKMGFLYLSEKKLVFFQGQTKIFEIFIDSLKSISIVERNWIPGKMIEQLRLTQETEGMKRNFYLSVKNTEQWMKILRLLSRRQKGKKNGKTRSTA